jgi:NADH dehydrogenase
LLTFAIAGGGFAGVEVVGALNDFVRNALRYYPTIKKEEVRLVLIHPKDVILPELGEDLGRYAQKKLIERGVEILIDTRVSGYAEGFVALDKGEPLHANTLVWTAGVTPGALIEDLPCEKEKKRLKVNACLELPGYPGVWALGDCASAIDTNTGRPFPTTAQHAIRQGKIVAENVAASLRGDPQKPFRFKMLGQLAAIGHRAGVAQVFGFRFSGLLAWLMWRAIYLLKLPRTEKKIQVFLHWTVELFFSQNLTQFLTPRDIEKAHRMLETSRQQLASEVSPTQIHEPAPIS